MATFTGRRAVLRLLTVAVVGASIPIIGRPASAHTEVEVEPARAGATNAVTLTAEAESGTAGVTAIEVFLPVGIAPRDVTLVTAPRGWHLSTASESYRVSGPPLAVGQTPVTRSEFGNSRTPRGSLSRSCRPTATGGSIGGSRCPAPPIRNPPIPRPPLPWLAPSPRRRPPRRHPSPPQPRPPHDRHRGAVRPQRARRAHPPPGNRGGGSVPA